MSTFIEQFVNGLSLAGIYLLVALGVTLVFGLTRIVNFAQGALVTLGAFLAYAFSSAGAPLGIAVAGSAIAVGLLSEVLDFGVFRKTLTAPLNGLIASLGLIIALTAAYGLIWPNEVYSLPSLVDGHLEIGSVTIATSRLVLLAITAVVTVALFVFVERSRYGRGIRALSENRMAAQILGVRVGRLISVTFILGSAMAGLAGALLGTLFPFSSGFGDRFLIAGFAVAIVGGLGSVRGAVVASLLLAEAQTLGGAYISLKWSYSILLVAMILILVVRPNGIYGKPHGHDPLSGGGLDEPGEELALARAPRGVRMMPRAMMLVLAILGLSAPTLLQTNQNVVIASLALINAIAVYGMWFAFRFAGIFSIAQAGLVGVGAYSAALIGMHVTTNFWVAIIAAAVSGAAASALIGGLALRTSPSNLLIVLFAINTLLVEVARNSEFLGGSVGLVDSAGAAPFGSAIDFTGSVDNFYYLCLVLLAVIFGFLVWLSRRPFGHRLTSIRDNEVLAASLGLHVFRYKLATLTVAGAVAGIAGALVLWAQTGIQPESFDVNASITFALILILGGVGTLTGPLVGAFVAGFLPNLLGLGPQATQLVYGLLLVGIIMVAPHGLAGIVKQTFVRFAVDARTRTVIKAVDDALAHEDVPSDLATAERS